MAIFFSLIKPVINDTVSYLSHLEVETQLLLITGVWVAVGVQLRDIVRLVQSIGVTATNL